MPKKEQCRLFNDIALGYTGYVVQCKDELRLSWDDETCGCPTPGTDAPKQDRRIGHVLDKSTGDVYYRQSQEDEFLVQTTPQVFLFRTCYKHTKKTCDGVDKCQIKEVTYEVDTCNAKCVKVTRVKHVEGVYYDLSLDHFFQAQCGSWIEQGPENNVSKKDVSLVQRYVIEDGQADLLIPTLPELETDSVTIVESWSQNLDQLNGYQLTNGGKSLYFTFDQLPAPGQSVILVYKGKKKLKYACAANEYVCFVVNVILEREASQVVVRASVNGPGVTREEYKIGDQAFKLVDSTNPQAKAAMEENFIPKGAILSEGVKIKAAFFILPAINQITPWQIKYEVPNGSFDVKLGKYTVPEDGDYFITSEFLYTGDILNVDYIGYFIILVKTGDVYHIIDSASFFTSQQVGKAVLSTGASLKAGDEVYPALYDLAEPETQIPLYFRQAGSFLYRAGTTFTITRLN